FCMFLASIWITSATSSTAPAFSVPISPVTMPVPVFSRNRAEGLQALQAEPLEGMGAGPRLERAGAEEADAAGHEPVGGAEDHRLFFDRARAGDDRQVAHAEGALRQPDDRVVRMHLVAGE